MTDSEFNEKSGEFEMKERVFNKDKPDVVKIVYDDLDGDYAVLSFEDFASGIPIYNLPKLLIPSFSSKTIESSGGTLTPDVRPLTNVSVKETPLHRLYIVVGSYVVKDTSVANIVNEKYQSHSFEFVCQLSEQVPLPVARDDILINRPNVREELEINMNKLLREVLQNYPQKGIDIFFKLLSQYGTASYLVPKMKRDLKNEDYLMVPLNHYDLYASVLSDHKLIGVSDTLPFETEDLIIKEVEIHNNVFIGRYVIIQSVIEPTTADSIRLIFMNNLPSEEERTSMRIIYRNLGLFPIETKVSDIEALGFKSVHIVNSIRSTLRLSNIEKDLYLLCVMRLKGLGVMFESGDVESMIFFMNEYLFKPMNEIKSRSYWEQIVSIIYDYCSSYVPNMTYGSGKKHLYINTGSGSAKRGDIRIKLQNTKHLEYTIKSYYLFKKFAIEENIFPVSNAVRGVVVNENDYLLHLEKCLDMNLETIDILFMMRVSNDYSSGIGGIFPFDEVLDYWQKKLQSKLTEEIIIQSYLLPAYSVGYYLRDEEAKASYQNLIWQPVETFISLLESREALTIYEIPHLKPNPEPSQVYYLSRLLQNVIQNGDVNLEDIDEERGTLPLQIIEMAINEGTTKPFLEATITETFQNSIDATRNISNKKIEIDFGIKGDTLSYSISDGAGIPDEAIVALSIPFLSSKKEGEGTGEIGSGFFNIYRDSIAVSIDTFYNEKMTIIYDEPVRSCNGVNTKPTSRVDGRVIDVRRTQSSQRVKDLANGTTITVYFVSETSKEDLVNAIAYCRNVLPISSPLIVNGNPVSIQKELIYENDDFDVYSITGGTYPSYVMTRMVPFTPLLNFQFYGDDETSQEFLYPFIANNCVLDLRKNFEPTQSRTQLRIYWKTKVGYITGIYYFLLHHQLVKNEPEIVRNYASKASIEQVLPNYKRTLTSSDRNISTFIFLFIPEDGSIHLQDVILTAYRTNKYTGTMIQNEVARRWIESKDRRPKKKEVEIDVSKAQLVSYGEGVGKDVITGPVSTINETTLKFLENFVQAYAEALGRKDAPRVGVAILDRVDAHYNLKSNIIRVSNILKITPALRKPLTIEGLVEYIDQNDNILSKQLPSSILVHELEHFIRHAEHSGSSHDNVIINGKSYTFDESANYNYERALKGGMLGFLLKSYNA